MEDNASLDPDRPADAATSSDQQRELTAQVVLRAARHYADLSQRDLAAKAGVHLTVVSRIEAGVSSPRLSTVVLLLSAAGVRLVPMTGVRDALAPRPYDNALDAGLRHWPAHLQVREVHDLNDWWKGKFLTDMRPLPMHTADWVRRTDWWRDSHGPPMSPGGTVS